MLFGRKKEEPPKPFSEIERIHELKIAFRTTIRLHGHPVQEWVDYAEGKSKK